mgnify:CR=1 FL=1
MQPPSAGHARGNGLASAIVSVAHRESLAAFHDETLEIERMPEERVAAFALPASALNG